MHFVNLEPVVQHSPPALEPEMELVQPLRIQLLGHMELKFDLASAPAVVRVLFAVALVDLVLPGLDPEGNSHRERVVDQHIPPAQRQSRSERVLEDRLSRGANRARGEAVQMHFIAGAGQVRFVVRRKFQAEIDIVDAGMELIGGESHLWPMTDVGCIVIGGDLR